MSVGIISGFEVTRVATTALTTIKPASGNYVVARLVAGAAAATLYIHNTAGTTAATTRVATLKAAIQLADELGFPIRCPDGVRVVMTPNTAEAYIGIR